MTYKLKASEILQPALLLGPSYRVRELVVTDWGVNTYAIDSDLYGPFLAHGNADLVQCIAEIGAMKRMDDMMLTEEFAKAQKKAAKREVEAAEDHLPEPGDFIEDDPKSGIGKFFHRIGQSMKDDDDPGKARNLAEYMSNSVRLVVGAKLDLSRKLGINPYSTNPKLQQKLDNMSRALGIGGYKMTPGPAAAETGASLPAVLMRNQTAPDMESLIYSKSEGELRVIHQETLLQMGVSAQDSLTFLSNRVFTPWLQTQFVTSLQKLVGVKGRDLLVRDAALAATQESDAFFYAQTARLLASLVTQNYPIDHIEVRNRAPYCVLRDGSILLALHWDYARWSRTADECASWLQTLQVDGQKPKALTLAITGVVSARCRQELEQRGFRVLDRLDRGPLK